MESLCVTNLIHSCFTLLVSSSFINDFIYSSFISVYTMQCVLWMLPCWFCSPYILFFLVFFGFFLDFIFFWPFVSSWNASVFLWDPLKQIPIDCVNMAVIHSTGCLDLFPVHQEMFMHQGVHILALQCCSSTLWHLNSSTLT